MPKSCFPHAARRTAWWLAQAVLCSPLPALAHNDGAYWHDAGPAANNPQWMLTIGPTKTLSDLSLPGTHDSGTYSGAGGSYVRTQTMTIREQLNSGIRWLDIRLKYYDFDAQRNCNLDYTSSNCRLMVYHGIFPMPVNVERDVLAPTIAFLRDNPSELVIMRIAKETGPCDCNPAQALDALLEQTAVLDGVRTGQKYADYVLPASCPDPELLKLGRVRPLNATPDPRSCEARGKLLIIDQYMGGLIDANHHYRLQYDKDGVGSGPYVAPGYGALTTQWDFYDNLWLPVKAHLNYANAVVPPPGYMYNAGISANFPAPPYFWASGHVSEATGAARLSTGLVDGISANASTYPDFPRTSCVGSLCTISFEGMNTLVANHLARPEFHFPNSRVGIVSADFPGSRFITAVAGVNAGVTFNRPSFAYTMKTPAGQPYQPGSWTNGPVTITPVCSTVCFGDRAFVSEDLPDGFTYTVSGGGHTVRIAASPVRFDATRPTIVAAAATPPVRNGWYTGNVAVRFTCADAGGSGVVQCPPQQLLTHERTASSTIQYALDGAGNKSNPSNIVTVNIDKTAPLVRYTGNLGSYAPGQTIDIRCEAVDRESGVASTTCAPIRGPASSFGVGVHRFTASATDVAGHTATGFTSFTVAALPGDVTADGVIDCRDLALVRASFGKRVGMVGFDARADTNGDAVVDIKDLSFVAQKLPAGSACQ